MFTRKIGDDEDNRLRGVSFNARFMKTINRKEILQGFSVGVFLIFLQYREIFSMAVVPQLQIWHFHWPASVKFVGDLPSHVLFVVTSYLTNRCFIRRSSLTSGLRRRNNGVRLPLHFAVLVEWVIRDPSFTTDPCCIMCVFSTPTKALYRLYK